MTQISKRQFLAVGLGAVAVAGIGYALSAGTTAAGFENRFLSVDEMRTNNGLVVDIRTAQEWRDTGVIEGATLATFRDPQSFLAQVGPALADGRDLILICRSGNRSAAAAQALAGTLPNKIISVAGGMKKIAATGYQTVPPA